MAQKIFVDAAALCDKRLSGVGQVTLETVRALARDKNFSEDHDIILIVTRKDSHQLDRHKLSKSIQVCKVPLPTKVWSGLNRFNIVPWADLLFGKGVYVFPNFRNWRLLRSKSITYIHDIAFILHPETVSPRNLSYLTKNVRSWLKRTDQVVTVSQSSKQEIMKEFGLDENSVSVIPNAVDGNVYYRRSKQDVDRAKKHVGIQGDYVLFVGNVEPRKNLPTLIKAFTDMPLKQRQSTELVIVGAGGWLNDAVTSALRAAARKQVRIIRPSFFVGNDELACLYSGARLSVLPSVHEGFGMPVLEALACGTRVAASNLPVLKEVGRETVTYFSPYDADEMSRVIATELQRTNASKDDQKRFRDFALRHTWSDAAQELAEIINRLETRA